MGSAADQGRADLLAWDRARPNDFFSFDTGFQRTLALRVGRERFEEIRPRLVRTGRLAANELRLLGAEANHEDQLPRLERWSDLGVRTESVVFHPSYHAMGRHIWETGVLSGYAERGRETEQLAHLFLLANDGELGHLCPLACTAGMIKVIQAVGTEDQKARWLPGLLSPRYDDRLHASQFLTEVQGGSDVGSNAVIARPDGGHWRIHGEKWFCSVIDAKLFLMTARPEGAKPGTAGLGLFLVPREIDGQTNAFHVRRLKRKLGTRAMASAEADFVGARAEALGPIDRGFKNVVERVLDTSRVYNAVCCAGGMQRAWIEASTYARHRTAFGQPIIQYPLVQEALATLRAEALAATAATFRVAAQGDALTRKEDELLRASRRMGVNVNKYWTSVRNTQMARLAMEVLGGNGAIESFSVVPQLYRDAMVLESWEGTHNTLVQQVMRDAERLRIHEPFLAELHAALDALPFSSGVHGDLKERVRRGVSALEAPLAAMAAGSRDQRWGRRIADQMAVAQALVALLEELAVHPDDEARRGAIQLLAERDLRTEIPPPSALPPGLL